MARSLQSLALSHSGTSPCAILQYHSPVLCVGFLQRVLDVATKQHLISPKLSSKSRCQTCLGSMSAGMKVHIGRSADLKPEDLLLDGFWAGDVSYF